MKVTPNDGNEQTREKSYREKKLETNKEIRNKVYMKKQSYKV